MLILEADCEHPSCATFAQARYDQLNTAKYTQGVSLMRVPDSREAWEAEHRTARKRAWRADRLGYTFAEVNNAWWSADIIEINRSLPSRQGRPMSAGYTAPRTHGALPEYPCDRHKIHTYGVLEEGRHEAHLRAYLTLYRVGDLAMVSMILGHGEHLDNGIMFLLFRGVVEHQAGQGGWFYYNRHDSGQDGLIWFKERLGFSATDIEWSL